jgi:hypothetical protein
MNQQLLTPLWQNKLREQRDQSQQILHSQVWMLPFPCTCHLSSILINLSADASRIAVQLQQEKSTRTDSSDSQPNEDDDKKEVRDERENLPQDPFPEESLPPTQVDLTRDISHLVVPKYARHYLFLSHTSLDFKDDFL